MEDAAAAVDKGAEAVCAREANPLGRRVRQAAFAAPFIAVAASLVGQLTFGRAVIWTPDSFGFMQTGFMMAAGADAAGDLERNAGYPLVAALLLPLGGLRAMVTFQSLLAVAGLAALLFCVKAIVRNPFCFGVVGLLTVIAALANDSFILYAQTINGDSLFGSLLTLSLALFLLAWLRSGETRAISMIGAFGLSYAAYLVKPNAILTLPLCGACLVFILGRAPQLLLKPRLLIALAVLVAAVAGLEFRQAQLRYKNEDFGPRTMFCFHLDSVLPDLGGATPQRRQLRILLETVRHGSPDWLALGYNGDGCFYDQQVHDAIHDNAVSEGMTDKAWLSHRTMLALLHHPGPYFIQTARQMAFFMRRPIPDASQPAAGHMDDSSWQSLTPYERFVRMPRIEFERTLDSWFVQRHGRLSKLGKGLLALLPRSLFPITFLAGMMAAADVARRRPARRTSVVFLAATGFVLATALTVALSHTFDVARYASSFALLSIFWWLAGLAHLTAVARDHVRTDLHVRSDGVALSVRIPALARITRPRAVASRDNRRRPEAIKANGYAERPLGPFRSSM